MVYGKKNPETGMTLAITNEEAVHLLSMSDCLAALEVAYKELAEGLAVNRPRSDIHTSTPIPQQTFRFKSMEGIVPGLGVTALRVNSDIVSWPKIDGKQRQIKVMAGPGETQCAFIMLFKNDTGELLSIIQDSYVQRMRVGAANGLAVKYLAREDSRSIGLIGSGWQAGAQLMAMCAVRPIRAAKVYSQNPEHCVSFAREMTETLGIDVQAVSSGAEAMAGADIMAAATSSMVPVLFGEWLEPGVHVSGIKRFEMDDTVFKRADLTVVHVKEGKGPNYASTNAPLEDIPYMKGDPFDLQEMQRMPELADVISGKHPGRANEEQITFFMNNIGIGIQFAAAAHVVYQRALECGIGREIPSDIFLQTWHS
jgi:ornithine cyclodeaminase/alanine dehydrogenase-like protein (mu-crystallin family)